MSVGLSCISVFCRVDAGDIFALLRDEPADTVELMIPVTIDGEGSYRFTVDRLMTVSEEVDYEGYTGNLLREVIAEELTVDFTVDGELESLDRTVIECGREFYVMGVLLTVDERNSILSFGYAFDPGLVRQTFRTVNPVYSEEIVRIWLENENDPDDVIVIREQ